jgi:transcriptional regulator with XRE-family HTH domain
MTNSHMTLGQLIRHRRETLDLSLRQLGQLIGTTDTTVMRIESGEIKSPRGEVLRALAEALGLPSADLFGAAGYTVPTELPSFRPYLRAKYTDLSPADLVELEAAFDDIARRHGTDGPAPGEDEHE